MSEVIIRVDNLGKKYRLNHQPNRSGEFRYVALRDVLSERSKKAARRLWATLRQRSTPQELRTKFAEDFWALQDISFEVKRGEVVGIIGRNGAGKSTLLKILSRITEPTRGRVTLDGRVASLLEVGTGFHPELTGRENIFLNGAILGMKRTEIRARFDEIVAFAEIERFLDTPVKRYSSGMYVRLAFAVAAHLEPEILIIDEVLAVGDVHFQNKCMAKMRNVTQNGRTVLFVSHNIAAVTSLCSTAITIKSGKIIQSGSVRSCVETYRNEIQASGPLWQASEESITTTPVSFRKIALNLTGKQPNHVLTAHCETESVRQHKPASVAIDILNDAGVVIMQAIPTLACFIRDSTPKLRFTVIIELPPLTPGRYSATFWIGPHNTETYHELSSVVCFEITETPTKGRSFPHGKDHGDIVPFSKLVLD